MGRARMKLLAASSAALLLAGGAFTSASAQAAVNAKHQAGSKSSAVAGTLRYRVCGEVEGPDCEFVWDVNPKSKTWVSESDSELGGHFEKVGTRSYVLYYEDGYAPGCTVEAGKERFFGPITGAFYCEGEFVEALVEVKRLPAE
jgi:hypothetical protein